MSLVSGRTPREAQAATALLRQMASDNRKALMEPWRERLSHSEGLRREMERVVSNLQVFFNKWTVEIVIVLGQHETLRFSELRASLAGTRSSSEGADARGRASSISSRTLTQRLRDLEEQGMVKRKMYDEMPVRVEYSLTPKGLDVAALALPLVLYLGGEG